MRLWVHSPMANALVLYLLFALMSCSPAARSQQTGELAQGDPGRSRLVDGVAAASAFPGAEGYGAKSMGGRGGKVIEVTNVEDSGPGSLRSAIEATGPRTVVFRTGGTIELRSPLEIIEPYITIAGQTAPGGGVTLRNGAASTGSPLIVRTHDVIIRYVRSRPGAPAESSTNGDAIEILGGGAYNVILDHCSFSWAIDEVASTWYDAHDITVQWSIIAEGLDCSVHEKGCHSKGLLVGSEGSRDISIHHNLFAHNAERNPVIKTSGLVDVVNNVLYNPRWSASSSADDYAAVRVNYVSNFFKRGADSEPDNYMVSVSEEQGNGFQLFVQGNIGPHRPRDDMQEWLVVKPKGRPWIVSTRHDAPLVTTASAVQAFEQVLADAGATVGLDSEGKRYWRRDDVDQRIVDDVKNGTGHVIDDPSEVGGWPELAAGTPPADSDRDGMPNAWEERYGLDPDDPSDGPADADGDGYTNIEEYLNTTDPRDETAWHDRPSARAGTEAVLLAKGDAVTRWMRARGTAFVLYRWPDHTGWRHHTKVEFEA